MRIFITYAREDGALVAQLGADLERSKRQVWIDRDLTGGQAWWEEILKQIRECDLYVFALSASSLGSRPCLRELDYAQALGRPLLPIKVGEVSIQQAPRVIADAQVVEYVGRTPDAVLALRDALDAATPPPALPDPLPTPPAVPISYFGHYREQIAADSLTFMEQQSLLLELKAHLRSDDDRDDAVDLLGELRRRHDLGEIVAAEIDTLLASGSTREPPPPPATLSAEPVATPPIEPSPPPLPTASPKRLRWLFAGVGLTVGLSLLVTLAQATPEPFNPSSSTTVFPDTTIPATTIPDTTVSETSLPEVGCPVNVDEFVLEFTEMEYGPFGEGYVLVWRQTGEFSTFDPITGGWLDYSSGPLDTWQELLGSPFQVCIDSTGIAYGVYAPFGSA